MNEDQIKAKLDTLADFQAMAQALELEKQQLLDAAIPAEVKERMAEIEAEFSGKLDAAKVNIDALTEQKESLLKYAVRALAFVLTLAMFIVFLWFVLVALWTPLG